MIGFYHFHSSHYHYFKIDCFIITSCRFVFHFLFSLLKDGIPWLNGCNRGCLPIFLNNFILYTLFFPCTLSSSMILSIISLSTVILWAFVTLLPSNLFLSFSLSLPFVIPLTSLSFFVSMPLVYFYYYMAFVFLIVITILNNGRLSINWFNVTFGESYISIVTVFATTILFRHHNFNNAIILVSTFIKTTLFDTCTGIVNRLLLVTFPF